MMRRWMLVACIAVLSLFGLGVWRGDAAQEAAGAGFVGAWRVSPTIEGQTAVALTTFSADGTVFTSNRPVQPAPDGLDATAIVFSLGQGSWQTTGENTADLTFVILLTDLDANFLGTRTVRGSLTMDESGDRWSGTFGVTIDGPDGTEIIRQSGDVEATRIAVEPMAGA